MDFPENRNTTVEDFSFAPLIYSIKSFDRASDFCSWFFLPSAESPWTFTPLASRKLRQASTFSIWWGDRQQWDTKDRRSEKKESGWHLTFAGGFRGRERSALFLIKHVIVWSRPATSARPLASSSVTYWKQCIATYTPQGSVRRWQVPSKAVASSCNIHTFQVQAHSNQQQGQRSTRFYLITMCQGRKESGPGNSDAMIHELPPSCLSSLLLVTILASTY